MIQNSLSSINDRELLGRFNKSNLNNGDVARLMGHAGAKENNVLGLDEKDMNIALQQLKYQLQNFKIPQEYTNQQKSLHPDWDNNQISQAWKTRQDELQSVHQEELAVRNKYNQELQSLLSQGSIMASYNIKQKGGADISKAYREASFGSYQVSEQVRLEGLTTNEYGMINAEKLQKKQEILK